MPYDGQNAGTTGTAFNEKRADLERRMYAGALATLTEQIISLTRRRQHVQAWDLICDGPERMCAKYRQIEGLDVRVQARDRVEMSARLYDTAKRNGFDDGVRLALHRDLQEIVKGLA